MSFLGLILVVAFAMWLSYCAGSADGYNEALRDTGLADPDEAPVITPPPPWATASERDDFANTVLRAAIKWERENYLGSPSREAT